jgi:hypothetical protein
LTEMLELPSYRQWYKGDEMKEEEMEAGHIVCAMEKLNVCVFLFGKLGGKTQLGRKRAG